MTHFGKLSLILLVAVALVGAGCGKQDSGSSGSTGATATSSGSVEAPLSGTIKISIKNFAYSPSTLVVKKGTVLEVTNEDLAGHSLTADGSFDTTVLGKGSSKSLTMDTVGTFAVHCTPHPSITGKITVVD